VISEKRRRELGSPVNVTVRLSPIVLMRLERLAKNTGESRTQIITRAIWRLLSENAVEAEARAD
jgi:predicted transcriptional regulator